jgi:4-amino-4-deoxy-L-arabinose transferase-like glycosyltransferase
MVAGARTFSLEETFLSPQILNPPPTRHALLAFLLALTAVLHIGTAGWGDLYDGDESQVAAAARETVQSRQWLLPTNNGVPLAQTPPLGRWAVATSFKIFGVNATAARLPEAFAMIGLMALTFLIGERLAGYWRGFGAGLILLCSGGAFVLGRIVGPGAIFAFFICGAIYCLVRGYQHQKFRRLWFALFWLGASLACLTKGLVVLPCLAAICGLLAIFLREARLRFRPLFHWTNILLVLAIVGPWFVWAQHEFPGSVAWTAANSPLPRWQLSLLHFIWWFPAVFLVLPPFVFQPRKILRPEELTIAEMLPFSWLLAAVFFEIIPGKDLSAALGTAPAFALLAAGAWARSSRPFRAVGIGCMLIVGSSLAAIPFWHSAIFPINNAAWLSLRPLALIAVGSLLIFGLAALVLLRQRWEITLVLALAAMVPVGWCLVESRARLASSFSLADAAHYLNPRLGRNGEVIFEGPVNSGSSLAFYLEKKFFFVNQSPGPRERDAASQNKYLDEHFVLDAWDRSDPIYLIIDEDRVAHWRQLITDRVHIYHQVSSCGSRVILSNQL